MNTGATVQPNDQCPSCPASLCTQDFDTKSVGEECIVPSQCTSRSCYKSVCECRNDSDCVSGNICDKSGDGTSAFLCIAIPPNTTTTMTTTTTIANGTGATVSAPATTTTTTTTTCNRPKTCASYSASCGANSHCPNNECCSQWG